MVVSLAVIAGVLALPAAASAAPTVNSPVIINEVYGGGGNSGATLQHDFVELYNPGTAPVDLSSWSVQYTSTSGTTWGTTTLNGSIPGGSTYVVRQAAGANTAATPVVGDATGTLTLSGTGGKVALVNRTAAITCSPNCRTNDNVVDLVGYGSANEFLGSATAAPANPTSVSRNAAHDNTVNNRADFAVGDPTPCNKQCSGTVTPPPTTAERTIAEIQGTGAASPFVDDRVRTTGVVTAVYPSGGFSGFYLQTGGTGGNGARTASDGIFVSTTAASPAIGDSLSVTGKVTEFFGLTQLAVTTAADVTPLPEPAAAVAPVTTAWPRTDAARETLEGMLYRPTGEYTITNTFATNTFGEVGLAFGSSPLLQPTEVELPGSPAAAAVEADNAARKVTLDDGASTSFSATNAITPSYVSNTDPVVVGGKATFTDSVIVDFRFGLWKFQPTTQVVGPANAAAPATFTDPRSAAPNAAFLGAPDVKVASFNVLNYFTTLGSETAGCQAFNDSDGNGNTVRSGCDLRGAWDAQDLARQQSKIVAALNAMDADVVGLMEIENSARLGESPDEAVRTLVAALNADAGGDIWGANPSSAELPDPSTQDVISNAIIYKKAVVQRVGAARALGTRSASGQAFDNAREPIGQVFRPSAGGSPFLFVVNHFKSKGSAGPLPGDADAGDGQGASNASRVAQAAALRDWIPTALTATGTKAVITVGDYNAYSQEDPIRLLNDAGYVDAEAAFPHGEYSYSFAGLSGSLDHVLLNQAALGRATGADIWNINSGESLALEYSRFNYSETDFHRGDPFRSSDHDPVVVGLRAAATPVPVQILATNDFHGRLQANGAEAGAAVLAGAVKQLRAAQPNTVFAAAGDLIGASTFESFIAQDKPTIDALNEAGLEVSAVGNHEFDQGYDDLVNRVLAPYDAQTNPFGGAAWEYLGANVRNADDNTPALPETFTRTFQGIKVGFVGVVTEDLPELVSPDGIAGLEVTDIVQAANRNADTLRAGGADIVVLLVHEGAPTDKLADAVNPNNAFGKIVTGVNDTIDAIVSGHTHLAYNHQVPVPGWADRPVTTRPVVSAGQYGTNLDQLLFQVDPDTEKVIGLTSNLLPLVKNPAYPTDPATKTIVDQAVADAAVLGARKVGEITAPFNRAKLASGAEARGSESTLGNFVAEVQRSVTGAQIALMNPGGLRADLVGNAGGYPADVTFRQAANVQPFANTLVNMQLTGAQLQSVLEQQWQPSGASRPFLRLGLSEGFTYTYDPAAPTGSHINRMKLDGVPVAPDDTFSVTVNSFLAAGGDNFFALRDGTARRDTGKVDLQSMVDYFEERGTASPDYTQRSVGVRFPADAPATYAPGDTVTFTLSSLAFSTAPDLKDDTVRILFDGATVGTFPVDNTVGATPFDENGTATVTFTVPAATTGAHTVGVLGTSTGTMATLPLMLSRGSSTTTVTSSQSPSPFDAPVTFTATVEGSTPTGTVQFSIDGTPFGEPVELVDGVATSRAIRPAVGDHVIEAAYSGGGGSTASTGTTTQVVQPADTTTTVTSSDSPSSFGSPVTFTATVTGPTSGGTVQFLVDGQPYGDPVPLVDGTATSATTSMLSVASHTVRATYSGDAGTAGSTGTTTQVVEKALSTTTVTSSVTPSTLGAPVRFTATVGSPAVRGFVQFFVDGQPSGNKVALSGGKAVSAPITTLSAGVHTIIARYTGDTGVTPSSGQIKQPVRYLVKVLSPVAGSTIARNAAIAIRFQLTDVNGVAIPDAQAQALQSGTPCRVTAGVSVAQTAPPTCATYDAASNEFRRTVASNGNPGALTVKLAVSYPGTTAQTVLVNLTRR